MKRPINNLYFKGYFEVARASDYLNHRNISNEIVRAPIKRMGCCGFTLAVEPENEAEVLSILNVENCRKR